MKSPSFKESELVASVCRDSFFDFVKEFWSSIIPERPRWNWHIEVICDELQRMAERVFAGLPKENDWVCNISPGTTKPVWEEMPVLMADGKYVRLKRVKVGDMVMGKSGAPVAVTAVHHQGKLPCVSLVTRNGRRIVTALDHPILTADGWKEAGKVRVGDSLALSNKESFDFTHCRNKDEEFALAGYLIGDGSLAGSLCYTSCTPEYLDDFIKCAKEVNFNYRVGKAKTNPKTGVSTYAVHLKNGDGVKQVKKGRPRSEKGNYAVGGPRDWCRKAGMLGKRSREKTIPTFVWGGTDAQVARFLATYFQCDGHVNVGRNGRLCGIRMCTISAKLAKGLQRLFLRLGINMRLRRVVNNAGFVYNRTLVGYKLYGLHTYEPDEVAKFAQRIPVIGPKGERLKGVSRVRFDPTYLADKVEAVEDAGVRRCRCLTVSEDESFVVDGVVVHNSTVCSVMFPIWCWTRMPSFRTIGASYSFPLAMDLSRKSRDLVLSDKFRACFPEIVLRDDQNTKGYFANSKGGYRYAVGINGSVLGMHAHAIVIDDPIDPNQSLSVADVKSANNWIKETLSSRKVDKVVSFMALVMQRLAQDDPTSVFLEKKQVRHLCLPAVERFNVKPPEMKEYYVNGLMDPVRLPQSVLDEARQNGERYFAAQFLQDPAPDQGLMFDVRKVKEGVPPRKWRRLVRFWDKAGTLDAGAWTVGTLLGLDWDGVYWVLDLQRFRLDSYERERRMETVAEQDGRQVLVGVEQEPGSGGKESAEATVRRMAGIGVRCKVVKVSKVTGDKVARADPWSVQVNAGNVRVPVGAEWVPEWKEEHRYFPASRFKDQVDSAALAFSLIQVKRVKVGGWGVLGDRR